MKWAMFVDSIDIRIERFVEKHVKKIVAVWAMIVIVILCLIIGGL